MPIRDSPMVSRASSMEHMHSFGVPVGFKKSPIAFSGTGFAFGGAGPEYIRKASTTSLTNDDLSAQKVSASGEITRAENSFKDNANHLRSMKSMAKEELSKPKEATKTDITMRNEMGQRELLSAKARSSEILATQHSLMAKVIEDVKETLKEAYTKEIKEEVLAQYQSSSRTLKEDAKAEFIKQIAPDVKAELRLELRQDVKEELIVELNDELHSEFMRLKAHLKGEVTSALRAELASEVRTELKAMYTDSVKDELRALYSDQIKDELRQNLVVELDAEAETDHNFKDLVQWEMKLEPEWEDANERNPSVFTEDANEGNPLFERDEFTENVNERNPSAERDEFTDAASQVYTGETVRDHDLDRSQFSMSPQNSLPESETCDQAPSAPIIYSDALSPIARQAKISTQSPSPAYSTTRSYDDLDYAHDALNDEQFYAKGAIDAPDANDDEEAISPPREFAGEFGAESVGHEDDPGNQWGGKPGMYWDDYQAIEGDEASAMHEEGSFGDIESFVYGDETPTDRSELGDIESFVYGDETPTDRSELGDIESFVYGDQTPTDHSELGDEAFIENENKKGTNSPSSSPWPRIAKRALDADGYWGSPPKRARDDSRESGLFMADDEQEARFEHEDGNEDMDGERGVPGPDASPDSRADWYHGGQPAVGYRPLDNRGSSIDDPIEIGSDSENEAIWMIQGTLQPSIEVSPEPAGQGSPWRTPY